MKKQNILLVGAIASIGLIIVLLIYNTNLISDLNRNKCASAATANNADSDNMTNEMEYNDYFDLSIGSNTQRIFITDSAKDAIIEFGMLTCEVEMPVLIQTDDKFDIFFNGELVENGEQFMFKFDRIASDYDVDLLIKNKVEEKEYDYKVKSYNQLIEPFTVSGKSPLDGNYYFTTLGIGNAIKIDGLGNILCYFVDSEKVFCDFKKIETTDGVRYALFEKIGWTQYQNDCTTMGEYIIYDENYNKINTLRMVESEVIPQNNFPVDQHDMLYIDDSEYYVFTYLAKNVSNIPNELGSPRNGVYVMASVIQGFKNGKLCFEWDSTDYPELYRQSVEQNDFSGLGEKTPDYAHINSIDMDPNDGNIICSFRNLDEILKINVETGEIMWTLGGRGDDFGLDINQKTSRQHYARYTNLGSITVYDNASATTSGARVTEYWLDESEKELEKYNSYVVDGYYCWATGSAQRVSDDSDIFTIGWGYRASESMNYPDMSVVDFSTNKTLFELRMVDRSVRTYRCVYYE